MLASGTFFGTINVDAERCAGVTKREQLANSVNAAFTGPPRVKSFGHAGQRDGMMVETG